ncbi:MAG: hypothetical protein RMM58_01165 [Chloroflexota bacterium]|nr:hypothetical protein [Dehalococcoidia bacterium]MDW8252468.1 hypothetical protein [Chloroflexota bacterium]
MKTIAVLLLVTLGAGFASFGVTAVLISASVKPASADSVPDPAAVRPVAVAATPAALPTSAGGPAAGRLPAGAAVWRPEAEGVPRPLSPLEVPAYLERTAVIQLGIREGLLDRKLVIAYRAESGTLVAELRLRPDPRQREFAQVLVQSLVSSVQALELPIRAVHVSVADAAGRLRLVAEVGGETARARPALSWEQSAAGTRAFLAWAAAGHGGTTPETRVTLSGEWAQ